MPNNVHQAEADAPPPILQPDAAFAIREEVASWFDPLSWFPIDQPGPEVPLPADDPFGGIIPEDSFVREKGRCCGGSGKDCSCGGSEPAAFDEDRASPDADSFDDGGGFGELESGLLGYAPEPVPAPVPQPPAPPWPATRGTFRGPDGVYYPSPYHGESLPPLEPLPEPLPEPEPEPDPTPLSPYEGVPVTQSHGIKEF